MRHGTAWAYKQGCRCDECRGENSRRTHEYYYLGRSRDCEPVDNSEVVAHLRRLVSMGFSTVWIGERAGGIDPRTIQLHLLGKSNRIRRMNAEAILAVLPSDAGKESAAMVSSRVAKRLIREVVPKVMSGDRFTQVTGLNPWRLVKGGQISVTTRTHRKVVTLYMLLAREGLVPASALEDIA